ncbi:MAG: WD40 repeat domain-containing protein, partial [Ktedonobacteraceae bacterium]
QRLPSFLTSVGAQPLLAWSPNEDFLAIGGDNNTVQVYSYPARQIVTTYNEHTDTITALAWSPDGTLLASGSRDTTTRLWEPHSGQTKLVYQGQSGKIASLDWSPDSTRLVSTADDQTAKIWRVNTGTTLATYHGPGGGPIGQASWSHDAQTIAVYGGNANIYLLDPQTGQVRTSFASGVAYSLSWSPDDTRIVTGNYFNVAQVWRVG